MQVFGLPGHIIRNARGASRLLAAQTPNIEAARRRDALARWRQAMAQGLASDDVDIRCAGDRQIAIVTRDGRTALLELRRPGKDPSPVVADRGGKA